MTSIRTNAPIRRASIPQRGGTRLRPNDQELCELEWRRAIAEAEIQALKKIRLELEEAQNRFSAFYEQSPVGYVLFDQRGQITDANTATARLSGFKREKLRRLPFSSLVHRDDARHFLAHLARCRKLDGKNYVTELRLQSKKGEVLPVQLVTVPFAEDGRKKLLTAVVDLTERWKSEEALAQAREFSESILETVREPLAVLDGDLKITATNGAFAQYFQKPASAIKGAFLESLVNLWWSGNQLRGELERVLIKNTPLENFMIEVDPPGLGRRALLLNARRMYHKPGAPSFLLVALEDITARKQTEENLRHANEELEKRVQARTEALQKSYQQMESFCYSIAHDLREPLRGMAMFSYLLADEYGPQIGAQGKDYARRIQNNAQRMDRLIQDLLNYGRLNTMSVSLADVELETVFEEVLAHCQAEIEQKRAKIEKKKPLPRVHGHPVMLRVALTNLVSNALKFVAHGIGPKVMVSSEDNGNQMRVWIKDNGIGIAPEHQKLIFGVFQRLHVAEGYSGTGIGLALVRQCVERIGGTVGLRSVPGRGSQFWIDLPKPLTGAR